MKISYAVTVCDEFEEIKKLLEILSNTKRNIDEVVVLLDTTKSNNKILDYLTKLESNNEIVLIQGKFNNHFADWKNKLNSACTGDYIFQIDADEYPHLYLLKSLHIVLESNPVDLIRVSRVNTVKGLTSYHIQEWGWNINKNNWVNWPDKQWRIYKNNSKIKWEGKVHEKIIGHETFAELPEEEAYSLYHPKNIKKQEAQNNYYNTL